MEQEVTSNIIKDFAEQYSLDIWDWFAAIIAVSSLVIAASSLVIATKTLRSQRATQNNTAPIITMSIQEMLWIRLLQQIQYNIKRLFALKLILEKNNYHKKPEDCFIQSFTISIDSFIHEELFYSDEKLFKSIHLLKEEILDYNRYFISIANKLNNSSLKKDSISRMFKLIDQIGYDALDSYQKIFHENDKSKIIDKIFYDLDFFLDEKGNPFFDYTMDNHIEKNFEYSETDVFISFFNDIGEDKYNEFRTAYYEYVNWYAVWLVSGKSIVLEDI